MFRYEPILRRLEERVRESFARQVLEPGHPDHGGFFSEKLGAVSPDHSGSARDLAAAACAFLAPGAALAGDERLFERIEWAAAYLLRKQRPSGRIDLLSYNWDSPPDTAFTVQLLAPLVGPARQRAEAGDERARRLAETLGTYIRRAIPGIAGGGFQTPNHRWVVCSALAQAMTLFPELRPGVRPYVDSILAEGVDLNADGQFEERSAGIYDAVGDRSLRLMADHLERLELLGHVRANLDCALSLLHADGTIVTSLSRRQDRGKRLTPASLADSFFDLAQRDGNGVWATAADLLVAGGETEVQDIWPALTFLTHPGYRGERLPRMPLPDDFSRHFPASGFWRVRRGRMSATVSSDHLHPFSLRYGEANLDCLKIAGTYAGTAKFRAERLERLEDGGVRLTHLGGEKKTPGYSLPLGRPVAWGAFHASLAERERWTPPALDQVLEVHEAPGGFDLRLKTLGGLGGVPMQFEFCFDGPGEWETPDQVAQVANGQGAILKSGYGVFRRGGDAIRIGPGEALHRMWRMRDTAEEPFKFRVLIAFQTPADRVLEIRCGRWSHARQELETTTCTK